MAAGEDCKDVTTRMLGDAMGDEPIQQLPQISAPNGEGFMHHRLQVSGGLCWQLMAGQGLDGLGVDG